MCVYIYIYRERERDRYARGINEQTFRCIWLFIDQLLCNCFDDRKLTEVTVIYKFIFNIYIYIYVYIYIYRYVHRGVLFH